jgi:hypothetical protein
MPVTNNNKDILDLPFFELLNQAPVATSALSGITTAEGGTEQFMYYMVGSAFYRYDLKGDTWHQLATPNTAPVTILKMRYTSRRGFHGRVLGATSGSITIPATRGPVLDTKTISIEFGRGAGQERVLTYTGETTHDAGVITATTTSTLTDGLKKWKINQWAGFTVGITFGTDVTHYKKILYNDATTLTIADANLQPHDPWNNQIFVAATPYALPVITAGSQAHYQIMSSNFTVSTAWDITPDYTSFFTVRSGGIYLLSSNAAAPFFSLQYYDVANDIWQTKTVPQSVILAALGTDIAAERTGKVGTVLLSGSGATVSASNRTLVDTSINLSRDRYSNHRIFITSGSGIGQNRRIVAHNTGTFTIPRDWETLPNTTSKYEIWPDSDRLYMGGGAAAAMFAYSPQNDYWMQGQAFDDGVVANISCQMSGWSALGVSTGARIAAGVTAVNPVPTAAGSNYVIGDVLTCSVGGTGAQVIVTSISAGGLVTGIELTHAGTVTGFTVGTGRATTGGTGTGCTIEITSVGATALITTATAHWFHRSEIITFAGCSEAAWNTQHTIIGVNSTTTFSVAVTATANMAAANSQSTTLIVDPSKNWIVNEHVGRLVHLMVSGTAPTSQTRLVTANAATTLTVNTITAGVNGTSKYVIYDSKVFGVDEVSRVTGRENSGWATSGSTTSIIDSSKSWVPNQWSGSFLRIEAGTGYGSGRIAITSNGTSSINYAVQTFTPNISTKYEIADTWGPIGSAGSTSTIPFTGSAWPVNYWAGKRVRITGGTTGLGQEAAIVSNTAAVLTTSTITASSADASFAILSNPVRGAGTELVWAHSNTDQSKRGRYMYFPRGGGSNTLDIYDISTGKFTFGYFISPQNEAFAAGSSYTYDGANALYLSRSAVGAPIRILKYDIDKNTIRGAMTTTILQGTAHVGNFLEVVETTDGIKFIYALQNTGTIMTRAMIF